MNKEETSLKPRVLLAPLDWGLGHATRCIPIIHALIELDCHVIIAAEGKIKTLLQKEFPSLKFIPLQGYNIHYSKSGWLLPASIIRQIPKILRIIKYENLWLQRIIEEEQIDAVISDNRFGLHHKKIPCVFITHQLLIETGLGKFFNNFLQKLNYEHINQYSHCWVPDGENENALAGKLSHPGRLPATDLRYIGPITRLKDLDPRENKHLLILISGPEPQRSVFEKIMLDELKNCKDPVVLVRGLPGYGDEISTAGNVEVFNHLPADDLQEKISQASFVISRCGYSSVMDLLLMKKKTIMIPTPGQKEQEYLSKYLGKKNFSLCISQEKFRLKPSMDLATRFAYRFPDLHNGSGLKKAIEELIKEIMKGKEQKQGTLSK